MKTIFLCSLFLSLISLKSFAEDNQGSLSCVKESFAQIEGTRDNGSIHILASFKSTRFKVGYLSDSNNFEYSFGLRSDDHEISCTIYKFQSPKEEIIDLQTLISRGDCFAWKKVDDGFEVMEDVDIITWVENKEVHMLLEGYFTNDFDLENSIPFFDVGTEADFLRKNDL